MSTPLATWTEVVLRWLNIFAIANFAGGFIVSFACLRGQFVQSMGLGWAATWSQVALVASFGLLAQHIWVLGESSLITPSLLMNVLAQTSWGQAWLLREVALLVFIVGTKPLSQLPRPPRAWASVAMATLSIVAVCLAQALASHAAQSVFTVGLQAAHVLAASVWMGGLAVMILMSAMILRRSNNYHEESLKQLWISFLRLALVSLAVLAGTGLFNLTQQVPTLNALLLTPYGKILLTKIILVAMIVMIAAANGLALRQRATDLLELLARARVEVLLGVVILAISAFLAVSSPANGPEFDVPAQPSNSIFNYPTRAPLMLAGLLVLLLIPLLFVAASRWAKRPTT